MNTYEDLVSDNGNYTILAEVSDNDYQGETRFFLFDPATGRFGFTTVGLGSCSYCIRWYHTMGQAKAAVAEYDFDGNYYGDHSNNETFKLLVDDL